MEYTPSKLQERSEAAETNSKHKFEPRKVPTSETPSPRGAGDYSTPKEHATKILPTVRVAAHSIKFLLRPFDGKCGKWIQCSRGAQSISRNEKPLLPFAAAVNPIATVLGTRLAFVRLHLSLFRSFSCIALGLCSFDSLIWAKL
ncbi:hypothetical protein ACLOJK_035935 [Asimina triloba]